MAFNIGQLRKNEINNYSILVPFEKGEVESEFSGSDDFTLVFTDIALNLEMNTILTSEKVYYLSFKVKQMSSIQNFTIKLQNTDTEENENIQSIKSFKVPRGEGETAFELIFRPNDSYNQIVFNLTRDSNDLQGNVRRMNIEVEKENFYEIVNVIDILKVRDEYADSGLKVIKRLGIQAAPGFLFTLDGEEIRVGRSGMYQLNHEDIQIQYIGFIIKKSLFTQGGEDELREDFFIMDFKY